MPNTNRQSSRDFISLCSQQFEELPIKARDTLIELKNVARDVWGQHQQTKVKRWLYVQITYLKKKTNISVKRVTVHFATSMYLGK